MTTPLISIVMATYNRSNVLRFAIESVLGQTVIDWELLVIGDACTDDTAEVVAGFNDERIRFHNLDKNVGEQSGPNNVGTSMAQGRYVAYLNHDDLWLPDHLETLLNAIESSGADLVHGVGVAIMAGVPRVAGVMAGDAYQAHVPVPASLWLLRREVVDVVGGWRGYRRIWSIPSQDFINRVHRSGMAIESLRDWTCVLFPSGAQKDSYRDRSAEPQTSHWRRLQTDPAAYLQELAKNSANELAAQRANLALIPAIRQVIGLAALRISYKLRIGPQEMVYFRHHRRRGRLIEDLREIRGLPPRPGDDT